MSAFYENLLNLCASHGTTPSGVASAIGLSNAAASGWKKGKTPNDVTQIKIADFFSVDVSELMGDKFDFYENYVKYCNKVGKSPSGVALEIGISKSVVSSWKQGRSNPTDATAQKVADYFGVTVAELLGENEQKNKPTTINGDELSEAERDFILLLRSIPEQERDMVSEMIRAALRSKGLL